MWPFNRRCKHPFTALAVEDDHTEYAEADPDFLHINYHLFCRHCGVKLTLGYAKMKPEFERKWEALGVSDD